MDLYADAAKLPGKIPNHFACVSGVSIDIDGQYWSASGIDADCGSQNFWLPHQIGCDFTLNTHDGLNSSMSFVQNASWRRSRRAERKKHKGNCCQEYQDDAKESISGEHKWNGWREGIACLLVDCKPKSERNGPVVAQPTQTLITINFA